MYPILFRFGNISLFTYGLMLAIAFLTGIMLAKKEAVRTGMDPDQIMDLSFYILISALLGARIFYILTDIKRFIHDPVEIIRIWNGGLVFYGGFIGAVIAAVIFMKKHSMPLLKTADIMAPGLVIGQAIGRIGCLFAGCCYGKVCDLPWAITFHHPESLAPLDIPLHPTQLYAVLAKTSIFVYLWLHRKKKRFDGELFWQYVFLYGLMRSAVEFFRGDFRGQTVMNVFSISQVIGLSLALLGAVMLAWLGRHRK
ncbi:MAG: prolipoprotein diacylglyceryl transferase [Desulfatirhabdiaceae bacterium]